MERIIYHGSDKIIKKPEFGKGKLHNDYGIGFYCTEELELAKEWAVSRERDGFANIYEIDDSNLKIIDLAGSDFTALHWIELLLSNRIFTLTTPLAKESARFLHENFHVNIDGADVIIGYRADDSYFSYAEDFVNGTISAGQLSKALKLGNLGLQYVLKSELAFSKLEFIGNELAEKSIWYPLKNERDQKARREYYSMDTMQYIKNDLYMIQILDQEVKPDDPRLQ